MFVALRMQLLMRSCVSLSMHFIFPAGVDFAAMANEQAQADCPRAKDFPGFLFKDVPLPDRDSTILSSLNWRQPSICTREIAMTSF